MSGDVYYLCGMSGITSMRRVMASLVRACWPMCRKRMAQTMPRLPSQTVLTKAMTAALICSGSCAQEATISAISGGRGAGCIRPLL